MKFLSANVWLASCATVAALQSGLKVPGDSPIEFCNADRDHDLLQVEKIDFSPYQPQPGKSLQITFTGDVKKAITEGSYMKVVVKYGLIQLISTTADLCEQAGNIDLRCPIESGKMKITKSIDLQAVIPPGTYNVFADIYTDDDEPITCLKASVNFPRPGALLEEL